MKKNNQRGISLLLTILIMAAIFSIAIAVSILSLGEIKISRESTRSLTAYYAAESGVEWAMYEDRVIGKYPQTYSSGRICLDPDDEICYSVDASGTSPSRKIKSDGSYKTTVRSIESTY